MIVKDMYELIEQYTVPTPPEDFAVYQVILVIYQVISGNISDILGNFCTRTHATRRLCCLSGNICRLSGTLSSCCKIFISNFHLVKHFS